VNAKISLVTGMTKVVSEVISAVGDVWTNNHSAGLASSAKAELVSSSAAISAKGFSKSFMLDSPYLY
jgi:hypothetical protein